MNQLILAYNKNHKTTLKMISDHLNRLHEKSMYRTNVSIMREMHDIHFFDPNCNTCVMILNQYYSHFMGSLEIETYFKTKGVLQEIDSMMQGRFKGFEGKGFQTTNIKKKNY